MNNCIMYGLIILCIMYLLYNIINPYIIGEYFTNLNIQSDVDDRIYNVVSGFEDNKEAANKLSVIHNFMIDYMKYIKKKFVINREGTELEYYFVLRILNNYRPDKLKENNPLPGGDTSYVLNKGDQFGLCLRSKNGSTKNQFHELGLLKFVALHEISHLGTTTYGHNAEFWYWFKFVLQQATLSGLYTPVNYSLQSVKYCGIDVNSNPYFS
jgi:hypothetical protein